MEIKLLSWVLALCISCVFTIEIVDQNVEVESDQTESKEDPDVTYGIVNFLFMFKIPLTLLPF